MRRKHLLKKKMVLVDNWPDFSVLLIVDKQVFIRATSFSAMLSLSLLSPLDLFLSHLFIEKVWFYIPVNKVELVYRDFTNSE